MFDYNKVDTAIEMIIKATAPSCIVIIFGSIARQDAGDGSNLDVLVVFDRMESRTESYVGIARQFIGLGIPFDIVVMDFDEYVRFLHDELSFTHEIATTGVTIYIRDRDPRLSSKKSPMRRHYPASIRMMIEPAMFEYIKRTLTAEVIADLVESKGWSEDRPSAIS